MDRRREIRRSCVTIQYNCALYEKWSDISFRCGIHYRMSNNTKPIEASQNDQTHKWKNIQCLVKLIELYDFLMV